MATPPSLGTGMEWTWRSVLGASVQPLALAKLRTCQVATMERHRQTRNAKRFSMLLRCLPDFYERETYKVTWPNIEAEMLRTNSCDTRGPLGAARPAR